MAKRPSIPASSIATMRLEELARCAATMRASGEILQPEPWLEVIANILSAVPDKDREPLNGPRPPSSYLGLNLTSMVYHARRCGFPFDYEKISRQISRTASWRRRMSSRTGKPYRVMMAPDTIGKRLGITEAIRTEAKAWNIGTYDGSPKQRAKARAQRQNQHKRAKRRSEGAVAREEYEEGSLSRTRPWEAEGVSRATWYRRQKINGEDEEQFDMAEVINFTERLQERRAEEARAEEERQREIERQKEERRLRRMEEKRRAAGATPRGDYEANSLSRQKPWEAEGISRRTWERRRQRNT